jgi:surface antigen
MAWKVQGWKIMKRSALFVAVSLAISGCASLNGENGTGSPGGSATASAAGSRGGTDGRLAGSIVEAMGGGLIGSIGSNLADRDRRRGLEAEYRALEHTPSGQPVIWRSADSRRYGEVIAAAPYRVGSQDCRQYKHTVHVGDQSKEARGTACRNSNGSWTPLT